MKKVGPLTKERVVEVLTKSFDDNKSTNWAVRSDKKRVDRIRKLMIYALELCQKQDGVFLSKNNTGAIIYDYPKNSNYNFSRLIADLRFIFTVIGPERLFKVLKREGYIKKFHPKDDYIYLWFLGVLPEKQGNGTGGELLKELTTNADKKKLPIVLETSNPRNLDFYNKFGFTVYHEWNSVFIGFPVWFMKREPND